MAHSLGRCLTARRIPFPWPNRQFFDALVQLAEPPGGFEADNDEQVVLLAYLVWFVRHRRRLFRKWGAMVRSAENYCAAAHAATLVIFVVGLTARWLQPPRGSKATR